MASSTRELKGPVEPASPDSATCFICLEGGDVGRHCACSLPTHRHCLARCALGRLRARPRFKICRGSFFRKKKLLPSCALCSLSPPPHCLVCMKVALRPGCDCQKCTPDTGRGSNSV
eukprot:871918-Pelagomonas_calceolata.AAC.1